MNLIKLLEPFNLNSDQHNQLRQYADFLSQQNKVMNLTAIDDFDEIIEKHFVDSLLISDLINDSSNFCDVGSGAGFPGMVLAIAHPDKEFTLVEPTKKRCNFLNDVINLLNLENVKVVNARAEEFVKEARESFDVVSARAVANLVMLSELCLPLVKVNGLFIAMKGQKGLEEVKEAQYAIKVLGAQVESTLKSVLSDGSLRYNIVIKKIKPTPSKYPRVFGQIKKSPLSQKKGS